MLVGSGVIATMLEQSGVPWLEFAAALLSLPQLVLSTFCASDPPSMPTFTAAETDALLNVKLGSDFTSGLAKFGDLVLNLSWQQYCTCTSGALVVPTPPTPPAGTPIYQVPPPPTGQPCFTFVNPTPGSYFAFGTNTYAFAGGTNSSPVPNVTSVRISTTTHVGASPGHHYQFSIFGSADGGVGTAIPNSHTFPVSGSDYVIVQNPDPSNRWFYGNLASTGGGTGRTDFDLIQLDFFCDGQLPGTQQPCCPPDVATQSSLDLILKMVTLIQRQAVPFGYVTGTAHTGISGNGTISVFGLLGVKVDVTTAPSRLGETVGDPITLWEAGWVNIGTADGFGPRQFITSNPLLLLPVSPACTVIGYSIPSDVTVTITELLREP